MKPSAKLISLFLGAAVLLTGCSPQKEVAEAKQDLKPVAFTKTDECRNCGMTILNWSGPKAEVFVKGEKKPYKFCSVKCSFETVLKFDHPDKVQAYFVSEYCDEHEAPDPKKMLNAKDAFFVADSEIMGAMGKSLMPFPNRKEAENFRKQYGGKILTFDQIDAKEIEALQGFK